MNTVLLSVFNVKEALVVLRKFEIVYHCSDYKYKIYSYSLSS